jgi:hypothetical protein
MNTPINSPVKIALVISKTNMSRKLAISPPFLLSADKTFCKYDHQSRIDRTTPLCIFVSWMCPDGGQMQKE